VATAQGNFVMLAATADAALFGTSGPRFGLCHPYENGAEDQMGGGHPLNGNPFPKIAACSAAELASRCWRFWIAPTSKGGGELLLANLLEEVSRWL
jgi:hypothetical protein